MNSDTQQCRSCLLPKIELLVEPEVNCDDVVHKISTYYVINSRATNVQNRKTIRNTWATPELLQKSQSNIVFVIGMTEQSKEQHQEVIRQEAFKHGDILFADFLDTYANLSMKTATGLRWVSKTCSSVRYVGKMDDDVIINTFMSHGNLPRVVQQHQAMYGICMQYGIPHRNPESKWYASSARYYPKFYKTFCLGAFLFMSRETANKLAETSYNVQYFPVEDVYTTWLLAGAANVPTYHTNCALSLTDTSSNYSSMCLNVPPDKPFVFLTAGADHMYNVWTKSLKSTEYCRQGSINIYFY